MAFLCFVRFSTRGVQKHHKKLFGENPCQKHEEPKNTTQIFPKIRPENPKNLKKDR
jgi:hypothetical protein